MKFILALIAALLAVATCAPADQKPPRTTPAKGDFRNEFDYLLIETATKHLHETEKFLLHLSEEVADLEKTHNPQEKERILREMTVVEASMRGANGFFERELKRTDLNILERFNFEIAQATGKILKGLRSSLQASSSS